VAGHALGRVNRITGLQRTVGVAQFHGTYALDTLCGGQFHVNGTRGRLVGLGHHHHQTDDDEHRYDEGEKRRPEQLAGRFDGAGMGIVRIVAHGVL
jgi:hypothetical protein